MKAILLVLVLAATQDAQRADCTALAATQGAIVTLEKAPAPAPAPKPAPDGASVGGPLDTYHDAKALIDKGNALADRGKAILDQAQRDGKITLDIRLPAPSNGPAQAPCPAASACRGGTCPIAAPQWTPSLSRPQIQPATGGHCPGGVCPVPVPAADVSAPGPAGADTAPRCTGGVCQPRRLLGRWRR